MITHLPPQIYNNPFRMNGKWQLIEEPPATAPEPVSANMPAIEFKEPPPYIPETIATNSIGETIPTPIDPLTPEIKPKKGRK